MFIRIILALLIPTTSLAFDTVTSPTGDEVLVNLEANSVISIDNITKQSTTGDFKTDTLTGILDADSGVIYSVDITNGNMTINGEVTAASYNTTAIDGERVQILPNNTSYDPSSDGVNSSSIKTINGELTLAENQVTIGEIVTDTEVLTLDNTDEYTPSLDYHPATVKYVNDNAGSGSSYNDVTLLTAQLLTITPPAEADGTVTCNDSDLATAINCDDGVTNNDCSSLVKTGASITGLETTGDWAAWTGGIVGGENPTTTALVMSSDKTVGVDYAVCSFESQDLTTYTETDIDSQISLTSSTVTWTGLADNRQSMVTDDFSATPFDGDFTVKFETTLTASTNWGYVYPFALANVSTGIYPLDGGGVGANSVQVSVSGSGAPEPYNIRMNQTEDGVVSYDAYSAPTLGVPYFMTVTRDDDAGTNGTGLITLEIRTGSHTGTLVDTLSISSNVGHQNDFNYMYVVDSHSSGSVNNTSGSSTGYEVALCLEQ